MSVAIAGPAASIVTTIFSYFSPSKSPFYGVIAFGATALLLSCEKIVAGLWWPVAIPIWLVLTIALRLSFQDKPVFDAGQYREQLRFARSFSISSALLSIVLTAREVGPNLTAFWGNYIACFLQVLVFLLYAWARSATEESAADECAAVNPSEQGRPKVALNFVQFALITTTFLVGASYGLTQYVDHSSAVEDRENNATMAVQYLYSSSALYLLWALCIVRWFKHIVTLIDVRIPQPTA